MSKVGLTWAVVAVALLATCHTSPASTAKPPRAGCHPQGSVTVKRSSAARVFRYRDVTWACLFSQRRAFHLGDVARDDMFPTINRLGPEMRLAGRYIAYERVLSRETTSSSVVVLDMRTGKIRRRPKAYSVLADYNPSAAHGVSDLILTPRGSVSWILRNAWAPPGTIEVRKADGTTKSRRLDMGVDIDPTSLRIERGRVRWTRAGAEQSSALR